MTDIKIEADSLTVQMQGLDTFWAFKRELRVPLSHVSGVALAESEARRWWHGIRVLGTHIPGVITAGTFYERQGCVFWDVHKPERAIAIALHNDRYRKLVIEVADPVREITRIEATLRARLDTA